MATHNWPWCYPGPTPTEIWGHLHLMQIPKVQSSISFKGPSNYSSKCIFIRVGICRLSCLQFCSMSRLYQYFQALLPSAEGGDDLAETSSGLQLAGIELTLLFQVFDAIAQNLV